MFNFQGANWLEGKIPEVVESRHLWDPKTAKTKISVHINRDSVQKTFWDFCASQNKISLEIWAFSWLVVHKNIFF